MTLSFPHVILAAAFSACGACGFRSPKAEPARHVLLITVDGLRADHCSFLLYDRPTTSPPVGVNSKGLALDELALGGTVYAQTFCPSPYVESSLATLMTGEVPMRTNVLEAAGELSPDVMTLAQELVATGFEAAGFIALGEKHLTSGLERGLAPCEVLDTDEEALAAAAKWLESRNWAGAPRVFLWLHLEGPQIPFQPAPCAWPGMADQLVDNATLFTDPEYLGPADGSFEFREACLDPQTSSLTLASQRQTVALYDGGLATISGRVANFLERFRRVAPEEWEQTGLVLAGVAGTSLPEPAGWPADRWLDDDRLRVPLLFHGPARSVSAGLQGEPVGLSRVAPTILAWLGMPPAEGEEPGLFGPLGAISPAGGEVHPMIAFDPARGLYTLRRTDYRLIADEGVLRGQRSHMALFPVEDLGQLNVDVAQQRIPVVDEMRLEILTWFKSLSSGGPD
ncbi:MAG: sulfatase-like hydrolase/transferase [bacterium]